MKDKLLQILLSFLGMLVTGLLGLNLFIVSSIDQKIFTHMTNHEIHVPLGQIVTQAEFIMHTSENKVSIDSLSTSIRDINKLLQEIKIQLLAASMTADRTSDTIREIQRKQYNK